MPDDSQPHATTRKTRETNAHKHPGNVVAPKRRRTRAEKARDDELVRLDKAKEAEKRQEAIEQVAGLEHAMEVEDNNADIAYPRARRHGKSAAGANVGHMKSGYELEGQPKKMHVPSKVGSTVSQDKSWRANSTSRPITDNPIEVESGDDYIDIDTDNEEQQGRKLTRTYAMLGIPGLPVRGSSAPVVPTYDQEVTDAAASVTEESGNQDEAEDTPKPRKKRAKIQVREAIKARREGWEGPVVKHTWVSCPMSFFILDETTLFYHTIRHSDKYTNATGTTITNWRSLVAQEANPPRAKDGQAGTTGSLRTATSTTIHSKGRTTASSSAVVSKARASNAKPGLGGFADEDETEERDHALSSPVKGNRRLDSAGLIRVEHSPRPPLKKSSDDGLGKEKHTYTNANLPAGCQKNNVWRGNVVPTYIQYIAGEGNVWGGADRNAAATLREVWDHHYGATIITQITLGGPVFVVADQRLTEWRSTFGSVALMAINTLFSVMKLNTDEERCAYALEQLDGYNFLYTDVTMRRNGKVKRKGIFRGPLVLQVFSAHLTAVSNAAIVPSLGDPKDAKGALALASAAVERAFVLWRDGNITMESLRSAQKTGSGIIKTMNESTGKLSSKSTDFTQANWGSVTSDYATSISLNLRTREKFALVVKEASVFVKNSRRGDSKSTVPSYLENAEPPGERALLLEASDDDSVSSDNDCSNDDENDSAGDEGANSDTEGDGKDN